MTDREMQRMDTLCSNLGEHFKDYVVLVRGDDGMVSWRASDHSWAESATRQYFNYVQYGHELHARDEFRRGI